MKFRFYFHLFQITSTSKEQWKLLLEQNSIGYMFPDECQKVSPDGQPHNNTHAAPVDHPVTKSKSSEQDWQFVIPVPGSKAEDKTDTDVSDLDGFKDGFVSVNTDELTNGTSSTEIVQASGIFPAARARLASLRDLGAKKIGALKLKLIENKIKSNERGRCAVAWCESFSFSTTNLTIFTFTQIEAEIM